MDIVTRINNNRSTHRGSQDIYSRRAIEQAFLETFELVGGVSTLTNWAVSSPENYGEFLKLLTRFAPKVELGPQGGAVIEYRSNIPSSPLSRAGGGMPVEAELLPPDPSGE
jgi:hypothetical protein